MKIKTVTIDGKVYAVMEGDKPVYVYEDGKEIPYDAPAAVNKIKELNGEAQGHREAKEAAIAALKKFEGIEDPDAAKAAMETVANLDAGKLVQAGKVEEIKAAAKKTADEQVQEVRKGLETRIEGLARENSELKTGWDRERIGTAFANSKFITDRLAVPAPMAQKIFGEHFKVEDGKIVGYGPDGKIMYSRENHGAPAAFDEALSEMVSNYAFKDSLLRGSGGGSGGGRGAGNGGLGDKEISRAEFEKMDHAGRGEMMKQGFTVKD